MEAEYDKSVELHLNSSRSRASSSALCSKNFLSAFWNSRRVFGVYWEYSLQTINQSDYALDSLATS